MIDEQWEKEFDNEFAYFTPKEHGFYGFNEDVSNKIKDFIRNLISQHDKEMEEIKGIVGIYETGCSHAVRYGECHCLECRDSIVRNELRLEIYEAIKRIEKNINSLTQPERK